MRFCFEVTAIESIQIPRALEAQAAELIKKGEIKNSNELRKWVTSFDAPFWEYEIFSDTVQPLEYVDIREDGDIIWSNKTEEK